MGIYALRYMYYDVFTVYLLLLYIITLTSQKILSKKATTDKEISALLFYYVRLL